MKQKIFKSGYIFANRKRVVEGANLEKYSAEFFKFDDSYLVTNEELESPDEILVKLPKDNSTDADLENAIAIHKAYPNLNRVQASDYRFWTYLAHTTYWKYLQKRWPLTGDTKTICENILQHWFINGLNPKNLSRHGVSSLWWYAKLTYDPSNKEDSYILTREFFSMKDYSRYLIEEQLGSIENFRHAFLEFVLENPTIFGKYKETKARALMEKMNFVAAYTKIDILSKEEIKTLFAAYKPYLTQINKRSEVSPE